VAFDKSFDRRGQVFMREIGAALDFVGDVLGNVMRPALYEIESDNRNRIVVSPPSGRR
jgi:hypothetical protein